MGRGLSQMQKDILALLPWKGEIAGQDGHKAPSRTDLVALLGLPEIPSNRTSVSRAVRRLSERKLVFFIHGYRTCYQHWGVVRMTDEDNAQLQKERERLQDKYPDFFAAEIAARSPN